MRLKIETNTQLEKDSVSKAVLNTDKGALDAYKKQRNLLRKATSSVDEINSLKDEVAEIKSLLIQLINKSS